MFSMMAFLIYIKTLFDVSDRVLQGSEDQTSSPRLTQLMRMYRGSVALGSFRLQKPYITLLLSKVSVISAKPPPARQSNMISRWGRIAAVGPRWDGKTWSQTSVINPFFTRVEGHEVRLSQNAWWATANPCLALIRFYFFLKPDAPTGPVSIA